MQIPIFKNLLSHRRWAFAALCLGLSVSGIFLSCLTAPDKKVELRFELDSLLVGKFDSVKIELFSNDSVLGKPLWSQTLPINKTQNALVITKPDSIPSPFTAIISGIGPDGVLFAKQFKYEEGQDAPVGPALDVLRPKTMGVKVVAENLECTVGDEISAVLAVTPDSLKDKSFSLKTNDTSTVSVKGEKITCLKEGSAKVTVTTTREMAQTEFSIKVKPPTSKIVVVKADNLECTAGDEIVPVVTVTPDSLKDKTFSLKTMDTTTLSIKDQKITCSKEGTANVTVTATREQAQTQFSIKVKHRDILLSSIEAKPAAAVVGDSTKIDFVLKPDNADQKGLTFSSDDTGKAVVSPDGILKAKAAGAVNITLKAVKGDAKTTLVFTISVAKVSPKGLSARADTAVVFDTVTVDPLLDWNPVTTTEKEFTVEVAESTVAKVLKNRLLTLSTGTTKVTVTAKTGGAKDSFDLTVRDPRFKEVQPITKQWCGGCHSPTLTFNLQDSATLIEKGSKALLRLALPLNDPQHMPLGTEMAPHDLSQLLRWLSVNVKPVKGLSATNMQIALSDTVVPTVVFDPKEATNQAYTLESDNSASVKVVGNKLAGQALGSATITIHAVDGDKTGTFKVTVVNANFIDHIKPITTEKCGKCHSPTATFNLQDSTVLLEHGKEALTRIQLPKTDGKHMPVEGELTARELNLMIAWLTAHFVPLQSIKGSNITLKLGQDTIPQLTVTPNNASNKNYSLASFDTAKVKLLGAHLIGNALGVAPIGITTDEGKMTSTFNVTVVPWPVELMKGYDTSVQVGDSVLPQVDVAPLQATDKSYSLVSTTPAIVSVLASGKLRGIALGTTSIVATSVSDPSVKTTFNVTVGPVPVQGLTADDQNLLVGSSIAPSLHWNPAAATDKSYTLSVVSGVGFVSLVGSPATQVNGLAAGVAQVKVTSTDGNKTATYNVTVGNIVATSISLQITQPVYADVTYIPGVIWVPNNTTIKTYTLSTTTPATLSLVGNSFKPIALGTGTLKATATVGGATTQTSFTIYRPPFNTVSAILYNNCAVCHKAGTGRLIWSTTPTGNAVDSITSVDNRAALLGRIQATTGTLMPPVGAPQPTPADLNTLIKYFSW